ncbi:MAG: hypothetical protein GWN67_24460 [Phycisphaerae bacterium]|nr:hypothetical protein [Phycisphaerae bacterium]NIR66871.1 hypothetical protein [candidate division Zixibacteria bacterium]NIP51289.1 hypothetical protein [Phycisphaerae bacterium]NIS54026.1 hypothetical protein [Phycisphaerae bacterium]NIU11634.1 hypothetical protein [Phycisphaerae bacterium]
MNCNKVERHQVLTFFFDGVPTLDGETNAQDSRMSVDPRGRRTRQVGERPGTVWFVHEPWKNRECNLCHKRLDKVQWALPELTAPVPILCYDCHPGSNYAGSVDYVHGPVAVGDCMRCHKQHKSKQEYLLKIPVPDVCYQCHEKADILSIPDHSVESLSKCLECHIGHSSSARGLLKEGWDAEIKADSNESPDSRLGDELLKLLRDDILKKGWNAEIKADSNESPDSRLGDELLKLLRDDI